MGCASKTGSAVARIATGASALSVIFIGIAIGAFHLTIAGEDSVVVDRFRDNDAWVYSSIVVLIVFGIFLFCAAFRPAGRVICGVSVFGTLCAFILAALACGQAVVITRSGFGEAMSWSPNGGKFNMHDATMQQAVSMANVCRPSEEVLFRTNSGISVHAHYDCGDFARLQKAIDRAVAAARWGGPTMPEAADRDGDASNDQIMSHYDENNDENKNHHMSKHSEQYVKNMTHDEWARMLPTEAELEKCLAVEAFARVPSACLLAPVAAVFLAWRFIVFGALMCLAGALLLVGGVLSCCVGGAAKKNMQKMQHATPAVVAYQSEPLPATAPLATAPPRTGPGYPNY